MKTISGTQLISIITIFIFLASVIILPLQGTARTAGQDETGKKCIAKFPELHIKYKKGPGSKDLFPPLPSQKKRYGMCRKYYSKSSCDYIVYGNKAGGKGQDISVGAVYDRCVKTGHKKSNCDRISSQ